MYMAYIGVALGTIHRFFDILDLSFCYPWTSRSFVWRYFCDGCIMSWAMGTWERYWKSIYYLGKEGGSIRPNIHTIETHASRSTTPMDSRLIVQYQQRLRHPRPTGPHASLSLFKHQRLLVYIQKTPSFSITTSGANTANKPTISIDYSIAASTIAIAKAINRRMLLRCAMPSCKY